MAAFSPSPEALVIPVKSFYSSRQISPETKYNCYKENGHTPERAAKPPRIRQRNGWNPSSINTNRGVKHNVRRRTASSQSLKLDSIFPNLNENLRNRIETNRQTKKQVQEVHDILRESRNPIELAKPLRSLNMVDDSNNNNIDDKANKSDEFSDLDSFSDDSISEGTTICQIEAADEVVSTPRPETPNGNRKFFKSGQTSGIAKQIKITDNIKAIMCNGKMSLVMGKRKVRRRPSIAADFSIAQAAVKVIIKHLDDHIVAPKIIEKETNNAERERSPEKTSDVVLNQIELSSNTDYSDFRSRIPYNTDDSVKIEEQHFLLDFLISNNICNENTFNIFIADPENHKLEATKIVNEVLAADCIDDDFRKRIPFNTDDPDVIERQQRFLEFLITNNLMTEENFDIFIASYDKRRVEANAILASFLIDPNEIESAVMVDNVEEEINPSTEQHDAVITDTNSISVVEANNPSPIPMETDVPTTEEQPQNLFPIFYPGHCRPLAKNFTRPYRPWNGGYGTNQFQIDAGQKEFGAKQCKQCGLVYGAHEPEEEKLHRDFHSSLHVLRFKGWIDEDRIADYPEWGRDGRIIRITDSANPKRRERLCEILKIVDKELGFSSYIIPKTFVAYLAVRNCLIVGFCLVQPLEKANKYICIDGVDCCTIEEFEAKCGISRIWVAPLHRRMNIAKKLVKAAQLNTIMGEEISLDKIAFSAPTEDGKRFAQKLTRTESFLVYQ